MSNEKSELYAKYGPKALYIKTVIQMLIGLALTTSAIVLILMVKLVFYFTGDCGGDFMKLVVASHPLKLVSQALAMSAGV